MKTQPVPLTIHISTQPQVPNPEPEPKLMPPRDLPKHKRNGYCFTCIGGAQDLMQEAERLETLAQEVHRHTRDLVAGMGGILSPESR